MILGKPNKLESQFRLTYSMILNLLRAQTFKVEEMIKRSFSENRGQMAMPDQQKLLEEKAKTLEKMSKLKCLICISDIYEYYSTSRRIITLNFDLKEKIIANVNGIKALCPGRIVIINNSFYRNAVAMIIQRLGARMMLSSDRKYQVLILTENESLRPQFLGTSNIFV